MKKTDSKSRKDVYTMIQPIERVSQSLRVADYGANEQQTSSTFTSYVQALEEQNKERNISENEYDVRHMTFDELKDMATQLHEARLITTKELMTMTFDYGRATESIKAATNAPSASFTIYETNVDNTGHRDWIAEFEARATKDKQYGHLIGYATKMNIVRILQSM